MAFITTFECRIDEAIKQVEAGYADDVLNYVDDLRSAAPTPQAADEWVNKNSDICIAHGDPKKPAYTIAGEPMTQQLCTAFAYDSASMFIADHTDENGNLSFPKSNAALTVPLPEPKRTAAVTPASMTRGIDASSVETPKVPLPPTRPEGMGRSGS